MCFLAAWLARLEAAETSEHEVDLTGFTVLVVLRVLVLLAAVGLAMSRCVHRDPGYNRIFWVLLAVVCPEGYLLGAGAYLLLRD